MAAVIHAAGRANCARADLFRDSVAPVFEKHCVSCHNDDQRKGGLSLQTRAALLKGGESGQAIKSGDADASLLLDYITGDEPLMPKNGKPLSASQIEAIRQWIDSGAAWPAGMKLADRSLADKDWWSLAQLTRPEIPKLSPGDQPRARTPIDAFIIARLRENNLDLSPQASRRTLIRRLYFDLQGVPPTPADIEAFFADPEPLAYEKLVDRLLASPRYGERWARHWLDVAHYGDTHGYDKDKLRPNAWPYRDYVIRSFNIDKPYTRFVEEQLAGDTLYPHTPDGIVAQGFISAGPWDFVGHAEVPETKLDGRIARHLDRDDMVSATMNTFVSMTAQCAQCHNHKFDPITQEDYYSLQSVFAALDRADRPYDANPKVTAKRALLKEQLQALSGRLAKLQKRIHRRAGSALVMLDQQIAELKQHTAASERPEFGFHSQISDKQDDVKWVQVDLGESVNLQRVILVGCHDNYNNIGAGFGFPVRLKIEACDDPEFAAGVISIADFTQADYANPGVKPQSFTAEGAVGRYVRVTAVKLAPRTNDYIFALGELLAVTADGQNAAAGQTVTSLDSIEAPVRWQRQNLVDGYYYGIAKQDHSARLAELNEQRASLIEQSTDEVTRSSLSSINWAIKEARSQLAQLPPQQLVYAGTVYTGKGAFSGTGASGGEPREVRVLARGDLRQPGKVVTPGAVPLFDDARFDLPKSHAEGERRAALARWIVDRRNNPAWRSIVNRVWQYHFGRGIVATPNDFGRMGALPTHPHLLDWLAAEFRDGPQSLKRLHRMIVTSAVYRQSSDHNEQFAAIDGDNRFLWRMNRRRLEAESIRDAALAAAGKLDSRMYGPGFRCFVLEKPEHSPHYQYHKHDPADPATHRRSIYRFIVRSAPDPFMETLDCADPSQLVARRNETVTPLQALAMLNNQFMIYAAEQFAARLQTETDNPARQIDLAFRHALGRAPTAEEQRELTAYLRRFGAANACRLILNLNEFAFVD